VIQTFDSVLERKLRYRTPGHLFDVIRRTAGKTEALEVLGALLSGDWDVVETAEAKSRRESSGIVAAYLQWHRGPTHGPIGIAGLAIVTAALVWAIQRYVEDPLSEELIRGHLRDGEVEVYLEGGQLSYRPAGELVAGRQLS
jgi:hypothetical protein